MIHEASAEADEHLVVCGVLIQHKCSILLGFPRCEAFG